MSFQQIAVLKSFTMSAIAVLALWLKMDAEQSSVIRLDRGTKQQAFRHRSARTPPGQISTCLKRLDGLRGGEAPALDHIFLPGAEDYWIA